MVKPSKMWSPTHVQVTGGWINDIVVTSTSVFSTQRFSNVYIVITVNVDIVYRNSVTVRVHKGYLSLSYEGN